MSRGLQHLARLNALADPEPELEGENGSNSRDLQQPLDEYAMFSNTTFYDFDIGRSTNIATTVDELLMAQERQIQYPQKGQAQTEDQIQGHTGGANTNANGGADAGPSFLRPSGFDFPLHEFSLAGELPSYPVAAAEAHHHAPALTQQRAQAQVEARARAHAEAEAQFERRASLALQDQGFPAETANKVARSSMEDDKRRRNTAASARFRIKKKMREQEMERQTRDMQQKIDELQYRVRQLEMENRLLRNLADERSGARDAASLEELRTRMLGAKVE